MRLTNKLNAQHLGWMFKKHWQIQGKRVPRDSGALAELEKLGIAVKDPEEILNPKRPVDRYEPTGNWNTEIVEDVSHPDWKAKPCHTYNDHNVLLEGVKQAQALTKTIEINNLPKNIEESLTRMQLPSTLDKNVQVAIMLSRVFDAEQVKLAKVKLADRPAYNLPRIYDITPARKNRLLINKLITECDKLAGRAVATSRKLLDNGSFRVTVPKEDDVLNFSVSVEKLMTSSKPLEPMKSKYDAEIPDLYPMKSTISMPKKHIYRNAIQLPFTPTSLTRHPHTIFLDFNSEEVFNLHGSSVSNTQFQSRTLMKAFAVAAARAKSLYGDSAVAQLPKPVVVQSVQTDGREFHFGVFQLNTLNLAGSEGVKNYWFHVPNLPLFEECGYKEGKPALQGYNKDVFRLLYAFYQNS